MNLSVLPFSLQLPSGYSLAAGNGGTPSPTASSAATAASPTATQAGSPTTDVVSISNSFDAGTFTAVAGDTFSLSALVQGQVGKPGAVAGYRIGLGGGSGHLLLNGSDVTDRISFTADEFAHLTYRTGTDGSQQSLVIVAQTGIRQRDGSLTQEVDSPAVQITADVTGSRSINAMNALRTAPTGTDANIVGIVQQAGIFSGFGGSARPTLQTDGNFSAVAGDVYRMSALFAAAGPTGQTIAGYRVALGDGGGNLLLRGVDVSDRTSFSADEFAHLTYTAGADGSQQSLLVIAQTGKRLSDGTLSREVDSTAVQITADVTGSRSINAMNALRTQPTGADADIAGIVQQSGIFIGFGGSARPTVQTDGNFTATAGDVYRMSGLFKASVPTGQTIAGYRVALGDGGGKLQLGGVDVSDRTSFSADEFARLTYTAGADGSEQSLLVIAQTGTRGRDGSLSQEIDSAAVQIGADVTGNRSINSMNALSTVPSGADARIVGVVKQAGIFNGLAGSTPPTLQTDGNFTAVAGDALRLSNLFKASAPAGKAIAGYQVALGDGDGKLSLNGSDVSDRTSFTADEFAHLTYTMGADGSQQSLVVVAQTGTRRSDGSLSQEVDSAPVQIAAAASGSRSINAMAALRTTPTGKDADIVGIVQQAGIFSGLAGSTRPTMLTDGNFTAAPGDVLRLGALFKARAPTGKTIAGYRVALGDGGGQLLLNGSGVAGRTSFTADEFAHLTYTTGADGSQQSLTVIAQTGTRGRDGTLSQEVDSVALQITVDVTGARSINALNALRTTVDGADADIADIVQQAGIFSGLPGTARPALQTVVTAEPSMSPTALATATGAYNTAGLAQASAAIDLSPFYSAAIGSSVSPGVLASPGGSLAAALLLLDSNTTGAFRTADNLSAQTEAIKAYTTSTGL
jgi:hypothetical protein